MNVDELVTVVLMVVVGAVTTGAFYFGFAGLLGAFLIVRCKSRDHWTFTSVDGSPRSCPRCHHPVLAHAFVADSRSRQFQRAARMQDGNRQQ